MSVKLKTCVIEFDDGSEETFRIHPKYQDYATNAAGDVLNHTKKNLKFMSAGLRKDGYLQLYLTYQGKNFTPRKHIFVYQCFHGLYDKINEKGETMVVKHLNNNKRDCNIKNLQLDTQSNNTKDALGDGLLKPPEKGQWGHKPKKCIGIDSKGTDHEFKSFRDAERQTGCNNVRVRDCCEGTIKSTASKTDGSRWKFKYDN